MRWGASLGYLGVLLIFSIEALRPSAAKLSARLSVLMPLQGLILLGLSPIPPADEPPQADKSQPEANTANAAVIEDGLGSQDSPPDGAASKLKARLTMLLAKDPVVQLFALFPEALGDTSYCQYVLQFIAYNVWPLHDLQDASRLICFQLFLLAISALTAQTFLPWSRDLWSVPLFVSVYSLALLCLYLTSHYC